MKFFWRKPSAPQWPNVVVTDYKPGVEVPVIADALCVISAEVMDITPPRVFFMKPGANPRARFMARLINTLKIFLFRDSAVKLTKREAQDLEHFCVFGVGVYPCYPLQLLLVT